jgi:hypothetical protein
MKIWNPINGTLNRTLNGHTENVLARTVFQNSDLASGKAERTIKI